MATRLALDLDFDGVPVNVNVALHPRVKKTRNESFKTIAPSGAPAHNGDPVDEMTGKSFDKTKARKGVPIPGQKGAYAVLSPEAIEQINSGVKTTVAKAGQYVPLDTLDLSLALDRYAIVPDDKVPGAEQGASILYNGLVDARLALVTQISPSGSMDGVLAVYAAGTRLWGALLPFESELYDTPDFQFDENPKAAALFNKIVAKKITPFDHAAFKSEYKARRQAVIDQVLSGQTVETPKPEPAKSTAPDLMALLETAAEGATA